ncbi:hypothetical protein F4861DRAFT_504128 [Xylaria intraflava]|nr:hypothetical protein F4861DRAFT_504128 [Xylaria intraflava]
MANRIPRKPVPRSGGNSSDQVEGIINYYHDDPHPTLVKTASTIELNKQPQVIPSLLHPHSSPSGLRHQKSTPELISRPPGPPVPLSSAPDALEPSRSRWKAVLDETVYFAGGLISHPFESTKHYSVLRHSPAVVLYRGPSTSVTISVFGDTALPSDRSFWLQRKGFSGNMGMAAGALMGITSNWIDVTPSVESLASSVPEGDERAWQRDIKKFLKKAAKDKRLSKHIVRETCVLRIPAVAEDGYLRIVMCTGQSSKKSLCPSPTFRLASTSSDASVFRGASLTTLPLEVGLKAASVVGNQYVQRVVGPVQAVVQSRFEQVQTTAEVALAFQSMQSQFGQGDNSDSERDAAYNSFHEQGTLDEPPPIIGSDSGPEKPFPITFTGKVVPGTGLSWAKIKTPTANLSNVSEDLLVRLNGVYIGWAALEPGKTTNDFGCGWHEAIITFGPLPYAPPRVAAQKVATVHIINDYGETATFYNSKLRVSIMAFLRPNSMTTPTTPLADVVAAISRDKSIAVASLSRGRWRYDAGLQSEGGEKAQRSLTDTYGGLRSQVQRRVDSVPVHWVGVRTDRAETKDGVYGRGGFYVRR